VALLLVTQRWGSYLGFPRWHLFVSDFLLLGAIVGYVHRERLAGLYQACRGRTMQPWAAASVAALIGVGVVRLAIGPEYSVMAIRDAAPFLYAGVVFLAAGTAAMASERERIIARQVIVAALLLHMVWVVAVLSLPSQLGSLPAVNPDAPVRFLELRADVDSALLAVLAAWGLTKVWRQRTFVWFWLPVAVVSVLALLQLASRVGPLALILCSVTAVLAVRRPEVHVIWRLVRVSALVALIAFGLSILPSTPGGTRFLDWVTSIRSSVAITSTQENVMALASDRDVRALPPAGASEHYNDPGGTSRARWNTWRMVWSDSVSSPARIVYGVGFGPNIVADAGATAIIGASPESAVRSPHNFLLTVFARTGLVGILVLALFSAVMLRSFGRVFRSNDQLLLLSFLLVGALSVGALFGVVMESPFGAIPVYWSAGVLLASVVPPLRTIRLAHVAS
jgi:hypothetical protein